jgi:hypothetical protein
VNILTSMFMRRTAAYWREHALLWIFGDNIEDAMGRALPVFLPGG